MCLDKITTKEVDANELIACGWKEFTSSGGVLRFQNNALGDSKDVPMDKWIQAQGGKIGSWGVKYEAGFHIYSEETELTDSHRMPAYRYRRVFYRGVETIGLQDGKTVVIARWMFVPTDPEAWPPLRK